MSKYLQVIGPLKGEDGKSAYQYAQDGGYTGTEAEFAEKLAAEGDAYTLPIASSTQLGGVKPVAKTDTMTQEIGVDGAGGLWTAPGGSGGAGENSDWKYKKINLTESVSAINIPFDGAKEVILETCMRMNDADNSLSTGSKTYCIKVNDKLAANITCHIRTSALYFSWHRILKVKNRTQLFSCGPYGNGNLWTQGQNVAQFGWRETNYDTSEIITNVFIAPYNDSSMVFPSDCSIEVWYR